MTTITVKYCGQCPLVHSEDRFNPDTGLYETEEWRCGGLHIGGFCSSRRICKGDELPPVPPEWCPARGGLLIQVAP